MGRKDLVSRKDLVVGREERTADGKRTAEVTQILLTAGVVVVMVAGPVVPGTASDAPVRQLQVPVTPLLAPERLIRRCRLLPRGQSLPLPGRSAPGARLRCADFRTVVGQTQASVLVSRTCVACTEL